MLLIFSCFLVITCAPIIYANRSYKVVVQRYGSDPLISYKQGSYYKIHQDPTLYTSEDYVGLVFSDGEFLYNSEIILSADLSPKVFRQPSKNDIIPFSKTSAFVRAPRITLNAIWYFMFYSQCSERGICNLKLAKSAHPSDVNSWIVLGALENITSENKPLSITRTPLWATQSNNLTQNYLFWSIPGTALSKYCKAFKPSLNVNCFRVYSWEYTL